MIDRLGVMGELVRFVWSRRNWWLLPLVIGLVLVGLLVVLAASTPAAPFLYPLF